MTDPHRAENDLARAIDAALQRPREAPAGVDAAAYMTASEEEARLHREMILALAGQLSAYPEHPTEQLAWAALAEARLSEHMREHAATVRLSIPRALGALVDHARRVADHDRRRDADARAWRQLAMRYQLAMTVQELQTWAVDQGATTPAEAHVLLARSWSARAERQQQAHARDQEQRRLEEARKAMEREWCLGAAQLGMSADELRMYGSAPREAVARYEVTRQRQREAAEGEERARRDHERRERERDAADADEWARRDYERRMRRWWPIMRHGGSAIGGVLAGIGVGREHGLPAGLAAGVGAAVLVQGVASLLEPHMLTVPSVGYAAASGALGVLAPRAAPMITAVAQAAASAPPAPVRLGGGHLKVHRGGRAAS